MSTLDLIMMIFQVIVVLLCFITSIFLLTNGIKFHRENIIVLGLGYMLFSVSLFLVYGIELNWYKVVIPHMLGYLFVFLFTQMTFHKKKNNRFLPLLLFFLTVMLGKIVLAMYFRETNEDIFLNFIEVLCEVFTSVFALGWLSKSSLDAYNILKNQEIEPWIKARLKLIGISSMMLAISFLTQLLDIIDPKTKEMRFFILISITIFTGIFSFGSILAWVMPSGLKRFLNKTYRNEQQEINLSGEIMNIKEIMDEIKHDSSK